MYFNETSKGNVIQRASLESFILRAGDEPCMTMSLD